jgi:hypothetical protein
MPAYARPGLPLQWSVRMVRRLDHRRSYTAHVYFRSLIYPTSGSRAHTQQWLLMDGDMRRK